VISTFLRDDEWQRQLAARFLDPFYRSRGWRVTRYPGDHPMQRQHVDVMLTKQSMAHYIDEKIIRGRRDGQRAEKINIETWSCSVPGKERLGWIARDENSKATIVLVCFADTPDLASDAWKKVKTLDCIWIPFQPLQTWFWQQGEEQWELQDNQQDNHSLSRKVPIAEIAAAGIGLKRFSAGMRRPPMLPE
jgi:hypothetical protein